MHDLKEYQLKAIWQLKAYTETALQYNTNQTLIFQAPTWAWKTITMVRYILELTQTATEDICFIRLSIWKWELHVQSYKSAKREIDDSLECSLLEEEFFGSRDIINQNEIVFLNWEKIRTKDKKTNEYKNVVMRNNEQWSFPEILENTRNAWRKIVLIIDESHVASSTDRAKELKNEIIKPDLTIEMSATPVLKEWTPIKVDPTEVINAWMIKKEIIINENIEEAIKNNDDEKTSEQLVLETAYNKQEELKQRYKILLDNDEIKNKITPLTLIQIPNSSYWEEKKEVVIKFLEEHWITTQNGKLAVRLTDEVINKDADTLLPLDSKVEFLIFKMAIDTWWDCPRAQILIKFRETTSIIFEIQTVWRILRMPEWRHYSDETLNRAFVYSNIQSISIKQETYNPNIIKSLVSKSRFISVSQPTIPTPTLWTSVKKDNEANIKSNTKIETPLNIPEFWNTQKNQTNQAETPINLFEPKIEDIVQHHKIILESYYKKRTDYWDITKDFYNVYEKVFCDTFWIKTDWKLDFNYYQNNQKILEEHWINFWLRKKWAIISDAHINSWDVDTWVVIDWENLVDIYASSSDLEEEFIQIIKSNLNGFAPVRSIPTVKMAIIENFKKYLNIQPGNKWIMIMQNIVLNNQDIFSEILKTATEKYKWVHEALVWLKEEYDINPYWTIPYDKNYNPNTSEKIDSKLSYYVPLYIEKIDGKVNQLELKFINYLDEHENVIEYFWKNWSEHMNSNFWIKKAKGWVFQPDFLIQFKDWKVWIFDTKAWWWFNEQDNKEKSEALQQYIVDNNQKWKKLIWWLVIRDEHKNKFYYFNRNIYKSYKEEPWEWIEFDTLLK